MNFEKSLRIHHLTHINRALKEMFLLEDPVDSLKLAVVMWMLTYVGAVFNGITILILADILLFAAPPLYKKIGDYTLLGPKTFILYKHDNVLYNRNIHIV
uniref:Reticulon n=1 Tax=Poecilia mexicana TaxID=48701 RepID=A0A3B3XHG1_9TELE